MSQVLAAAYGEVVKSDGRVDEKELTDLLKKMPVSIGAGKQTVRIQQLWHCCFGAVQIPCARQVVRKLRSTVRCAWQVSLYDFLPAACLADAVKIFEDFQRDL